MKIHPILFIIILITFLGGFLSGALVAGKDMQKTTANRADAVPQSSKSAFAKINPTMKTEQQKVLIGYVQDFRKPDEIEYGNLTHVIFSFAHPTANGGLLLNGSHSKQNLRSVVQMAKKHNTKVMLAVGGWFHIHGGESYDYFKAAISKPSSRKKLVNELIRLTEKENLDGIDIDFELPRTQEDARHLAAFAKELNAALKPKGKEISIAVNAKVHSVTGTEIHSVVFDPSMFHYFDHVNLMAYDGQWDGEYNAANLSPYSHAENIVSYWTELFDRHSISREKLVLGVPLYGQPEDPSIKQVSYEAIARNNPDNTKQETVRLNGTTYHYNSHQTLKKKTRLAIKHQLGGMMLWEAGLDAKGPHSASGVIASTLPETEPTRFYARK